MNRKVLAAGLLLLLPACAAAQSADPATRELIEKLLARIDGLERRVAELERGGAPQPTAPAVTVAAPNPAAVTPSRSAASPVAAHSHDQPPATVAAGAEAVEYPSLKISGFADLSFAASNLHGPSGGFVAPTLLSPHSGFYEGQTALHFSSALSSRVNVFGELSFTARSDAGTGTPPATGFNAEVERMIVRYDVSDRLKLSFGRYHTPINYWNTAFHHGQWLQTTISRPEMAQFGGSFIPVHFIGTLVEGATPAGGLNLNYNFGVGNGRGQILSRGGDPGDINNNRAWLVNMFVKPNVPFGLQIGGSVYRDEINPLTAPVSREWIQSAHIVWLKEKPEFIAEFANVTHQPVFGGPASNSQAFYAQIAWRLPVWQRKWKPYFRYEQIHVPESDLLFRSIVPTFSGSTAGVRYDFSTLAAFKLEYRHYTRRNLPSVSGIFAQTSFTF